MRQVADVSRGDRGRITVESRLGEGTTMRIHLPAAPRAEPGA